MTSFSVCTAQSFQMKMQEIQEVEQVSIAILSMLSTKVNFFFVRTQTISLECTSVVLVMAPLELRKMIVLNFNLKHGL